MERRPESASTVSALHTAAGDSAGNTIDVPFPSPPLPFIDVTSKPYSAKCDGVSDDFPAFDAALTSGKRNIFVPPGVVCRVSKPLILVGAVSLFSSNAAPHQAAALIETTDNYAYPNLVQNFSGMKNENPATSDATSYYVGLRNINFGVKNSTVKTVVNLVHLFETSAIENVAFWVDRSTVLTSVFKHQQNAAPQGFGGQWSFINTQFATLGKSSIARLIDITSSSVWVDRGNWVTGMVNGSQDAVRIALANEVAGDTGGGYGTIGNVNFEGSPGDLRAQLLWEGQGALQIRGCSFTPGKYGVGGGSTERPIAIRLTGRSTTKALTMDSCNFWTDTSRGNVWWWWRLISSEVQGMSYLDLPLEGLHNSQSSTAPAIGGPQLQIISRLNNLTLEGVRVGSEMQDRITKVLWHGTTKDVYTGISEGRESNWAGKWNIGDRLVVSDGTKLVKTFSCVRAGASFRQVWSKTVSYKAGEWVQGSDRKVYRSVVDQTAGQQDPAVDSNATYWEAMATGAAAFIDDGGTKINILHSSDTIPNTSARALITATGGSVTLTSTPTISDGFTDGQTIQITNQDANNVVTLQNQGTLPGSNLRLSAPAVALGPRDSLVLQWNGAIGNWIQIGMSDVL